MKPAAAVVPFRKSPVPFPLAGDHHTRCPRCHRSTVVRISVKAQSSPFDWFTCYRCNQVISTRSPINPGPQAA